MVDLEQFKEDWTFVNDNYGDYKLTLYLEGRLIGAVYCSGSLNSILNLSEREDCIVLRTVDFLFHFDKYFLEAI